MAINTWAAECHKNNNSNKKTKQKLQLKIIIRISFTGILTLNYDHYEFRFSDRDAAQLTCQMTSAVPGQETISLQT